MALENIADLSQDEQFEEAAKFAGVPASVLRSMWEVESGKGTNMRSPAGARGHFQAMPTTQATFEERLGRTFDPDNFTDSLVLAAHTMKENMALADGNIADALRWYNAGAPERWNNPETQAYVGKVLGADAPASAAPSVEGATMVDGIPQLAAQGPQPTVKQMWETRAMDLEAFTRMQDSGGTSTPVLNAIEKGVVSRAGAEAAASAIVEGTDPVEAAVGMRAAVTAQASEVTDAYITALAGKKSGTGGDQTAAFEDTARREQMFVRESDWQKTLASTGKFGAAMDGNALFAGVARWMERNSADTPAADPNWDYATRMDEVEANKSIDQIEGLRSSRNERELQDTIARQAQEQFNEQVIGAGSGTIGAIGWNMLGGLSDPLGVAAGFGVGKVFQIIGAGSRAAFAANKIKKGFALAGAEGALGNVGFTATLDAMGEYQSTNDYAASAGFGMVIGSAFGVFDFKGTRKEAAIKELRDLGNDIAAKAAEHDLALFKRAEAEAGPGATPAEVGQIARRLDMEDMERMQQTMLGDVPDDMRMAADARNEPAEAVDGAPVEEAAPAAMKVGEYYFPPTEHRVADGPYKGADQRIVTAWETSMSTNSMRPMLDVLASLPGLREDYRLLAQKLGRVADVSGLTPENARNAAKRSGIPAERWGGLYFPDNHSISLRSFSPDIALHEIVHAFSARELRDGTPYNANMVRLMNHTRKWISQQDPATLPLGVQQLLKNIKEGAVASHPLSDVAEFVAYGMTDSQTQALLKRISSPDAGTDNLFANAWDWMVDAVTKLLKLDPKERTVLSDLLNNATALLDDTTRELDGVGRAPSLGGSKPLAAANSFTERRMAQLMAEEDAEHKSLLTDMLRTNAMQSLKDLAGVTEPLDSLVSGVARAMRDPEYGTVGRYLPQHIENLANQVEKLITKLGAAEDFGEQSAIAAQLQYVAQRVEDEKMLSQITEFLGGPSTPTALAAVGRITPTPGTAVNNTQRLYERAAQKYGLDKTIPDDAERKLLAEMFVRSEAILAKYPIDEARLRPLLAKVGWEATSTRLLLSKNPVLRAFALMALENPEGAAGRTSTAAVTKQMLYQLYRGDADVQFKSLYSVWRQREGGSAVRDFYDQKLWNRFNKEVYAERDRRWNGHSGAAPSAEVSKAADVLDDAYIRMGKDQKFAGTLGNQRIELDKAGYQPRLQSAGMVGSMTDAQLSAYMDVVSGEFQATAGFDKAFADKFAREYLSRARTQAKGAYDVPATLHDPAGADIIRDALKALGLTQQEIIASLERFSRGGASHTKARIGADLTTTYPDGNGGTLQMMDLMVTDNLYLLNKYSHRVAGEVSLARFGILGDAGLKLVRRGGEVGPDAMRATNAELEAFDQTAAEFLGRPFGTALGKWGDNAIAATSALRLGGMGFNQMNEYANGVGALGVLRVGSAIKSFPRLLKEVWSISKGGQANNPLLNSLEVYGGKIGVGGYQLKGMFDVNEGYEVFGQEALGVVDKAIRAGSFANRVMSGHRAITAVQIRGMSEQIVLKALRYIREGKEDAALLDMGFTKEVQDGIRADLGTAAVFNSSGEVVSFDLSKIKDNAAAHGFLSSVHRGASQIIQSTYIGETGKWAHDGWLRMMTQFRTYGLTATQKQWRRQSFAYGTTRAVMLLMGAMSVAVPIHMARVYLRAAGKDESEREKFLERELSPLMMGRATMNYVAAVGLLPDLMEVTSAVTGGSLTGGRAGTQTPFIGGQIIPAAGVVNDAWKVAQTRDPHKAAKLLPGSNLPYLQGAINLLDE